MVLGIGADIVAVGRFEKLRDKEGFLAQVFSPRELARAPRVNRDLFYATLFAVKESVLKALGWGLSRGSLWHDVEVSEDMQATISGKLLGSVPESTELAIRVSHSGTREYAMAYVIIEDTKNNLGETA